MILGNEAALDCLLCILAIGIAVGVIYALLQVIRSLFSVQYCTLLSSDAFHMQNFRSAQIYSRASVFSRSTHRMTPQFSSSRARRFRSLRLRLLGVSLATRLLRPICAIGQRLSARITCRFARASTVNTTPTVRLLIFRFSLTSLAFPRVPRAQRSTQSLSGLDSFGSNLSVKWSDAGPSGLFYLLISSISLITLTHSLSLSHSLTYTHSHTHILLFGAWCIHMIIWSEQTLAIRCIIFDFECVGIS